jgi:hypothetical protein
MQTQDEPPGQLNAMIVRTTGDRVYPPKRKKNLTSKSKSNPIFLKKAKKRNLRSRRVDGDGRAYPNNTPTATPNGPLSTSSHSPVKSDTNNASPCQSHG